LGVLSRELCFRVTAEFGTPSPKSSAEFVIEETQSRFLSFLTASNIASQVPRITRRADQVSDARVRAETQH
jgi:hypothetical protein